MTQKNTTQQTGEEFRIRGINPKLKNQIKNIAKYYDVDTSMFLKLLLKKLVDNYPDHIKENQAEEEA